MKTIKIGRNKYEIREDDYILYNGACYQFCAGDGRSLKREGFNSWSNLRIPQSIVNKIPFDQLRKVEIEKPGLYLTKWYF